LYGYQDDVLPLYPFFMGPKEPFSTIHLFMVFRETNAGVGQTAKLVSWVLIERWLIDDGYSNLKKRAEKAECIEHMLLRIKKYDPFFGGCYGWVIRFDGMFGNIERVQQY
jgi:hypothetical protein